MTLPDLIADALRDGDVVVLPTDTVYGLVADPRNEEAMQRLFKLKGRPEGVPVAVLAASTTQARALVRTTTLFDELANRYWPGPITLVAESVDASLRIGDAGGSVGVRVPDHPLVQGVAAVFGPVAATSANRHGAPTLVDASAAEREFGTAVSLIVDGGRLDGIASTVVDVREESAIVLREGAIELAQD